MKARPYPHALHSVTSMVHSSNFGGMSFVSSQLSRWLGRESRTFYKCCENKVDGSWQFKQWKWAADDEW